MTGDVEDLLQISQQLDDSSAFIPSSGTMGAAEDSCIYTATIPSQLAPSFPQGSILRIMPDSAIVAVAVKNSNESYSSKEGASFPIEHLLATQPQAMADEEDDIDLSFLTESAMMPDPTKCLTDLNLLQGSTTEQPKPVDEQERLKDSIDQSADVVMIDVTKPIPLSQNSLIIVNGQKCVLQHNAQTGQVLAYPVQEQEKSRKRRGRPRKEHHTEKEGEQKKKESNSKRDNGSSEEEREKGLQEIVTDDGALVRRSSRKRKKARILRDYETGNLRQELGSDVEESADLDVDISHKKKTRGPGRPRKYTDANTGMKRVRGRPKKTASEGTSNEPSQAFLVQTADGQALMMQVPLSSMPAGISLQQMAQEIADKLNLGLNQASNNNPVVTETKEFSPGEDLKNVPEVALQDHSVGSTTHHFPPSVQSSSELNAESSLLVDVIDPSSDIVCGSEEVIFESENSAKEVLSNINQNDLSTLEVVPSEDHFAIHVPSSAETVDSTSTVTVYSHFDPLTDHDFCLPRSHMPETIKNNIETSELFDPNDAMKNNKVNIKLLLQNKNSVLSDPHVRQTPSIQCLAEESGNKSALGKNCLLPAEENNEDISSTVSGSNIAQPVQDIHAKQCKICKMPYLKDEEIIEHFKAKHPKCICTECHYMNEHPYVIKRHVLRHGSQGCICKICHKKYKDMYILKMHIKMVHLPPDVLYACEICDKKFTRKAHLKRHLRIHAPEKNYQCPHCSYKGCEKSDITKHLLIHEEPKFKCEVCGKAFRHLKNKELHVKRHSGQRDYKCAACGFFGYTYTDIRKHIERRHSVQNHCSQCKQVFSDIELFKNHQKTCQPALVDKNNELKILASHSIAIVSKEAAFSDEMPLDILDQPQVMCSEETLQNGQLVMTLEDIITSSVDKEKMITIVTTDGSNPLEISSSLPLENASVAISHPSTSS